MIERASEMGALSPLVPPQGDIERMSAGDMLREAREAHGLHIEVLAAGLKVPAAKLAALEADNIDALPDPVFARALAASVCRSLRIDPAPVLAKLPGAPRAVLADTERSTGTSFRDHDSHGGGMGADRPLSRPVLIVVGVLLLAAAVLFWVPQPVLNRVSEFAGQWRQGEPPPALSTPEGAPSDISALPVTAPVEAMAPMPPPALASASTSAVKGTATPASPAPAATDQELLVLSAARGQSWVSVIDVNGKVLLSRELLAGEVVNLSGAEPLTVVLGRAVNVDVKVRGKEFDARPLIKSGGVARFDVKT